MESVHGPSFEGMLVHNVLCTRIKHVTSLASDETFVTRGLSGNDQWPYIANEVLEHDRHKVHLLIEAELVPFAESLLTAEVRSCDHAISKFRLLSVFPGLRSAQ